MLCTMTVLSDSAKQAQMAQVMVSQLQQVVLLVTQHLPQNQLKVISHKQSVFLLKKLETLTIMLDSTSTYLTLEL